MNHSPQVIAFTDVYGGSDATAPSFNKPRYIRGGSLNTPISLGVVPGNGLRVTGTIGAESGTQTLFFLFRAAEPRRIALQRVPLNPYTDQYITLGLRGPDGNAIPLRPEAPPSAQDATTVVISGGRVPRLREGYVDFDYWDAGYAEAEDLFFNTPPAASTDSGTADKIASLVPEASEKLLPGDYVITVSSSQWPALPFRLQVLARPAEELGGVASFSVEGTGRVGLFDLDGFAVFQVDASGQMSRLYTFGANSSFSYSADSYWEDGYALNDGAAGDVPNPQVADFSITATALVQRLSPLQGAFF